jgi:hypothetical protein
MTKGNCSGHHKTSFMDDHSHTDGWAERHKLLSQIHENSARTQSIGYEQKLPYCTTCTMFEMIALLFITLNFSVNA